MEYIRVFETFPLTCKNVDEEKKWQYNVNVRKKNSTSIKLKSELNEPKMIGRENERITSAEQILFLLYICYFHEKLPKLVRIIFVSAACETEKI